MICLRIAAAMALFVATTGCAVWTKPGITEQEWRADSYACERDMRQSGYYGTGFIGGFTAQSFYDRCLQSKGYYKVPRDQVQQTYR